MLELAPGTTHESDTTGRDDTTEVETVTGRLTR